MSGAMHKHGLKSHPGSESKTHAKKSIKKVQENQRAESQQNLANKNLDSADASSAGSTVATIAATTLIHLMPGCSRCSHISIRCSNTQPDCHRHGLCMPPSKDFGADTPPTDSPTFNQPPTEDETTSTQASVLGEGSRPRY
jgi:hypothetical protein